MPSNPFKATATFHLTKLDRLALDPQQGALDDIGWWGKMYFDAEIFPWQKYFYHAPQKDKMVVAGIRVGKSKGTSFFFLHYGQFHPGARLLNTSISSEQAKIVYTNMLELLSQDRFKHWVAHTERSPYPLIRLVNGAEMWFRSIGYEAELIRGFEFDWINVDEAAYVTSEMAINTLKGRLLGVNQQLHQPRAGIFTQMTSPKGKTGWLYERWKKGDPRFLSARPERYLSLRVRTTDNPLLDQQALREIMLDYTDRMIRQELEGEFLDSDSTEFPMEQIEYCYSEQHPEVRWLYSEIARWQATQGTKRSVRSELLGLSDDLLQYEIAPQPGHQYIASWDLGKKATKAGRNATVGMVFDVTALPWRLVAYKYDEEGRGYLTAKAHIEQWQAKYSSRGTECYTVIDASGKGDVLNELIEAENHFSVDGIVYNNVLKPNLVTAGKIAIERGMVRFPFIKRMVDQLSSYEQYDKDLAQDIVMAFCQAMFRARELTGESTSRPSIYGHVYRRSALAQTPQMRRFAANRTLSRTVRSGRTTR